MKLQIHNRNAKAISYGAKRSLKEIDYIVIHYTGNKGDTAKGNAAYFATSNTRQAGAHYFVDRKGEVWCSIPPTLTAWAVGGLYSRKNGAGSWFGKCTNANSISIELCDCLKDVSWKQMLAVRELVQYLQKKCSNAKTILRHWDVNGKNCPAPMTGNGNVKWKHLHNKITKNYQFKAIVTEDAWLRTSPLVSPANKVFRTKKGNTLKISKTLGAWGRLLNKMNGKFVWVSLKKVKEI